MHLMIFLIEIATVSIARFECLGRKVRHEEYSIWRNCNGQIGMGRTRGAIGLEIGKTAEVDREGIEIKAVVKQSNIYGLLFRCQFDHTKLQHLTERRK